MICLEGRNIDIPGVIIWKGVQEKLLFLWDQTIEFVIEVFKELESIPFVSFFISFHDGFYVCVFVDSCRVTNDNASRLSIATTGAANSLFDFTQCILGVSLETKYNKRVSSKLNINPSQEVHFHKDDDLHSFALPVPEEFDKRPTICTCSQVSLLILCLYPRLQLRSHIVQEHNDRLRLMLLYVLENNFLLFVLIITVPITNLELIKVLY